MKYSVKLIITTAAVMFASALLIACGKGGYSDAEADLSHAAGIIAGADEITAAKPDIECTYSYMASSTVNNVEYNVGFRNILKMTGRGTADFAANRYNYYYGTSSPSADTYNYTGGRLYSEYYNTLFCSQMSEQEFLEYTDGTSYAVDRELFDPACFGSVAVKGDRDKPDEIIYRDENGTINKKIVDFFGFAETDYVYGVRNIEMTVKFAEDGSVSEKQITFTADYSTVNNPSGKITYDGNFYFKVDKTSDVAVITPDTKNATEISTPELVDNFSDRAYGVLSTFTTLDATYNRYVRNSDYTGKEYILDNTVHFTEAYRNEKYYYGSLDLQRLKTPQSDETVSNGIFIDESGYHTRSTGADDVDDDEPPFSDYEFIAMVFQTLSGERCIESDMTNLRVEETEDTIIYKYSFTEDAVRGYGEYLLASFTESGSGISLDSQSYFCEKNESVITVRKSDGCIISHTVDYNAVFGGSLRLESKFEMTVNATGDDVKVLTVSDWAN